MSLRVRRATVEDLEKLVEFTIAEAADAEGSEIGGNVREGVLKALQDNAYATYWVMEDAGAVIGNVSVFREWSDWNAGHYWWIQSMFIEPNSRGRGLIRLMLEEVRKEAASAKALELRLYVHRENSAAIRAYQKNGFSPSDYEIMTMRIDSPTA